MAWSVRCLPPNREDLSSYLQTHEKNPGVAVAMCNPNTVDVEMGRPLEHTTRKV